MFSLTVALSAVEGYLQLDQCNYLFTLKRFLKHIYLKNGNKIINRNTYDFGNYF